MKYEVVQTGSSGNCTILENALALDMGIPYKKIAPFVKGLQVVFVGHEHGDHFKASTIKRLAEERPMLRFCGGAFLVEKFLAAGVNRRNIDILEPGTSLDYGLFEIEPIELFHDVPCYGLRVWMNDQRAVYIVDTGHLEGVEARDYDLYLVEANHTMAELEARAAEKQAQGLYSYEVRAAENHLSYEQATDWLAENMGRHSIWIPMHAHVDIRQEVSEDG